MKKDVSQSQKVPFTAPFATDEGVIPETSRFFLLWNMSTFLKHLSSYGLYTQAWPSNFNLPQKGKENEQK